MSPLRIIITGCCGRMGRAVIRLAAPQSDLRIVAAVAEPGDALIGQDAGVLAGAKPLNVAVGSQAAPGDVLIDFTAPRACVEWAEWCANHGTAFVSGTTGLSTAQLAALDRAATRIPVLWSPNMSVGVNLLARMVEDLARRLDADSGWDIEIVEAHHRLKADAPSGTARLLLERAARGRGVDPKHVAAHGRAGTDALRKPGEIGVHALRLGGVVGDHQVHFASNEEIVTLAHHAATRDVFAAGALRAARWLRQQPAGRYTMQDVLA